MVSVILYPLAAATNASAIPVLPLVGSMICIPGFNNPACSAACTMPAPIRHLTENAGLRDSILASTVTPCGMI